MEHGKTPKFYRVYTLSQVNILPFKFIDNYLDCCRSCHCASNCRLDLTAYTASPKRFSRHHPEDSFCTGGCPLQRQGLPNPRKNLFSGATVSTESYKDQAVRLAERLAQYGISLPPTDILDTVAVMNDQRNWAELRRSEERSLTARLRNRVLGEPYLESVLSLEQLLHRMTPGETQLGVSRNPRRILALKDGWLCRHILLMAQQGVGGTTMLESLAVQQMFKGGLLFLDPWQSLHEFLENAARFAGRAADFQVLDLAAAVTAPGALSKEKISYVKVPLLDDGRNARVQAQEFFDHFWKEVAARLARHERFTPQFMVVVPEAATLMDCQWQTRYEHARAAGISIVTFAQGIPALRRANPDVAEIILENSYTKVFFKQPSATALTTAVECIEAATPLAQTTPSVRERLVCLGMGDMLISGPDGLEDAHTYMLKR
jgi:hypothetical protein